MAVASACSGTSVGSEKKAIPQTKLLALLHEAIANNGKDLDLLVGRLTGVAQAESDAETTEQVVALGFLACVKALRDTSLMQEVAIREEIQQIQELHDDLVKSLKETQALLDAQLLARARVSAGMPPATGT